MELIVVRIEPEREAVDRMASGLAEEERRRARRFRHDRDRQLYIVAHARLREIMGARLGQPPGTLQFQYGAHGKPALARGDLHFSLSRCGDYAAFALSRDSPVGVDIEAIRPIAEADDIAARIFPRQALRAYDACAASRRLSFFFWCWTRIEAILKALGSGIALGRREIEAALAGRRWRVHSFTPAPGLAGALASTCPDPGL